MIRKESIVSLIFRFAGFSNWVVPSSEELEKEYLFEYKNHIINVYGDIFPTFQSFKDAIQSAEIVNLSSLPDVDNVTSTDTKEDLFELIQTYQSYPKYRNEKTLEDIYQGFKQNLPMGMPIVLSLGNDHYLMSGNTRINVAQQFGIDPKVINVRMLQDAQP